MSNIYNFINYVTNTTFKAVAFVVTINAVPANIIDVTFIFTYQGKQYVLVNGNGITITNGPAGQFRVDARIFDWPVGTYTYKSLITLSNGYVESYFCGKLIIVDC